MLLRRSQLHEILEYEPDTGVFIWCGSKSNRAVNGSQAGTVDKGYVAIRIDGKRYFAHVLAWLYMTGEWPSADVDHINLNRSDNRWVNLRAATRSQNKANADKPRTNSSGVKGVIWDKERSKWKAQIKINGKNLALGRFDDKQLAAKAYRIAAQREFGEFARG